VLDAAASASETDVLTREAAAEDIDVWHLHGHQPSSINVIASVNALPAWIPVGGMTWRFAVELRADFESPTVGVGYEGAHVGITRNSGPLLSEDVLAELVLLAEPHSSHTRLRESEVESSDACE
jgi:hypothetical protein